MKKKERIFRPSKFKAGILFFGCLIFVALGVLIMDEDPQIGLASIIFFGIGAIVSLMLFSPNSAYLKLTDEGFEVKSLFRSNFTKWTAIKDLREVSLRGNKMVCYNYTKKHKKWNDGKKIAKFLSSNVGFIQSIYKIKTKDLIKLMNYYKRKSKKVT